MTGATVASTTDSTNTGQETGKDPAPSSADREIAAGTMIGAIGTTILASGPIPAFASLFSGHCCECWN
jgi:hypothetical protein